MDASTRLQRDWFRAAGVAEPACLEVHPDDEMFRTDLFPEEPHRPHLDYVCTGWHSLVVLENVLASAGRRLADAGAVLDFACGYGRLVRFLVEQMPRARVWASDILPRAVEFVGSRFGVHAFASATHAEDVVFPRRFDVIWVGSLFSHLPRPSFERFVRVLGDALTPDGLLLFSTHNPEVLDGAPDPSGFTFRSISESRTLSLADYGSAFVDPAVVRAICRAQGFAHVGCRERELWRIQDLHVLARTDVPGLQRWQPAAVATGAITAARVDARGHAWVGGFVRLPAERGAPAGVEICIDGDRRVDCRFARHAAELPRREGGARFVQWDWYVEGPAPELRTGDHTLCAVVRFADGARSCCHGRYVEHAPAP